MDSDARHALLADVDRVCDLVGTTLGPFGTNKLVVESGGRVTTTASSTLLLERLELDDPATTLLRDAATDFRDEWGDGSTRMVLLTGALLSQADDLIERGLHPTTVARGFRDAFDIASERLDARARPLSLVGAERVAETALTGTRNPATRRRVSEAIASAVTNAAADDSVDGGRTNVDVVARIGGVGDTELVDGVVIETPPVSDAMPRRQRDAGVALLSSTVDVPRLGGATDSSKQSISLDVESFEDRADVGAYERDEFRRMLSNAADAGCRFIATQGAVNDRVKTRVADAGLTAIERVDDDDMRRLVRNTGGRVVPTLEDVTPETMGAADVGFERLAGREFVTVEGTAERMYTLLCRAPDPRSVSAFEASATSAISATFQALADERVVPGGGATEIDLERSVREAARGTASREQLAMEGFARALTEIPRGLAASAGLDGWTSVLRLRVAHTEDRSSMGVDALSGEIRDVLDADPVVEPRRLQRAILGAATDLAVQLIRIDGQLSASNLADDEPSPPVQ
ncbi:TCP-1/cpn60 chaperonin family protein [Haloferax denitrificans]|uniref:HSP60 family chaperonin n=1 Tax=Haloferax denitrificans ATCC 35960 TaxID=662478 RepID=M0JDQ0_9EURY|nr:TCP-1/cpn60 chaperonin family protein [Haloferax denitrificans]EMA06473.1 HSP60 family chaperonin [Haloferax denitrificans ATCC 35960]